MGSFFEKIDEFSTAKKIVFVILSLAFVFYIFWQYFYSNMAEELTSLTDRRDNLNTKIIQEQRIARNLSKLRKEVKKLQVQLNFVMQELPDKKEIPRLLSSISDLARDAGLNVALFRPNSEVNRDFYAEVPVSVTVAGSFHEVASFFDDVGHLPRIVNITNISLGQPKKDKEGVMKLSTSCLITTFRYLDEGERLSSGKKPSKSKRRRR